MSTAELRLPVRDGTVLRALHHPAAGATGGIPVLLVHGLASNCRLWDGPARHLAELGHDVIALDLRGHGLSDKPDHGYSVPEVARDVVDIIEVLSRDNPPWRRPLVIGQSWGGNIVIEIAARHAEAVRGVVAVDGGTIELSRAFPDWEECRRALAPPRLAGMEAERLRAFVRGAHRDWSDEAIEGTMANMEHFDDGTIAPWLSFDRHMMILESLYHHRPSTRYGSITAPALLVPADTGSVEWTHDKRIAVEPLTAPARAATSQVAVKAIVSGGVQAVSWHNCRLTEPWTSAAVPAGFASSGTRHVTRP